ncbi:MAG: metallophosphoesterase [Candidatus Nanohalobium sp.]
MKIGIVSDTHDNIEKAKASVNFFEEENCETVIHCGDMVAPFTAELFDADFNFHAVRGNNDGEWNLKQVVEQFGNFYNNTAELSIQGLQIAVYHGTEEEIVEGLLNKEYDYVFRGHTHEKRLGENDGTVEVNPGGIRLPGQEEEFHVATLETEDRELKFHRVG